MKIPPVLLLSINNETVNTQQAKKLTCVFAIFELPIINYVCPLTFHISIVFNFPSDDWKVPKELKTMPRMRQTKCIMGNSKILKCTEFRFALELFCRSSHINVT